MKEGIVPAPEASAGPSAGDPFAGLVSSGCFFCGQPSQVLCDGTLAWLIAPDGKTVDRSAKAFTCDRKMCRACVAESGMIHFNMKPKHVWDSRDYCRDCVKEELHGGGNPTLHGIRIFNGMQRRAYLVTMAEGQALQARRQFSALAAKPAEASDAEQSPAEPSK